ncbi:MAG: hypothetical protein HY718_06375 [Planctomycetes bacterium]|nr:hypothetical protein [Planctomycetota bacterium]
MPTRPLWPTRRDLLKTTGGAVAASLLAANARAEPSPDKPATQPAGKLIGIQIGAVSFVDEGVARVLDTVQERAHVNAVFLAVFTYGRGIGGRQVPGQPLPDHGKQEYDLDFHGGNFATPHPEFYQDTVLKDLKAPDHGRLDILEAVLPEASKRGVRIFCWAEDVWRGNLPGIEKVQEVDLEGRRLNSLCLRNPDYRHFLDGLTRDYATSYPVAGLMWGSERQGPLNNALGASHGGGGDPTRVGCFCEFCREEARQRGISTDRAIAGYRQLAGFVQSARKGERPRDGHFVQFWRTLVEYPELLAWEKLWSDGQHEAYALIHSAAKSVRRDVQVGFHIWHLNSFSPFWRAEQDYARLAEHADFFKAVMYNNCGGPRFANYIRNVHRTFFGDLEPEEALRFHYRVLGYDEKGLEDLPSGGLSADYVFRETLRAKEGVAGGAAVYPGIDVDIPTGKDEKKTTPDDVREAVKAAFKGGADGIILSRKYSEMRLDNLSGAGRGLREADIVSR